MRAQWPPELRRKPSCQLLALPSSLPVDVLGTASPLFAPLIPICSATAQIQFGVACLQPPALHCLLGITPIPPNKGLQIGINPLTSGWRVRTLSRTVPIPAALKPFGFADLCLTPLSTHSPVTTRPDTTFPGGLSPCAEPTGPPPFFCDPNPSFFEVQLCPFTETNLCRV